ncbi:precorrin-3B synthase [Pontivivens ytuae]|uniref:Precorrin-3B synthase n=1 Tax=Pontivivens ytuae TaxID=2789856 RepID=A0A7S9LU58_9RHOB|nr:precorrin-3B synthase [Pontivivens ytuae]QPH55366.1 precorrin-3B synthase [Pontivivens ytuae]
MTRPEAKGWCPGAYRPMMSGDGLIVRVRPLVSRLSAEQVLGLCAAAERHGSGVIEVTGRANVQLRGVREETHPPLLDELIALGLLDSDPVLEHRRNIVVTPFSTQGDAAEAMALELTTRLEELPELPAKFGFAVDIAEVPAELSADITITRTIGGRLLVLCAGAEGGIEVTRSNAIDTVVALTHRFVETGGVAAKRMVHHVAQMGEVGTTPPRPSGQPPAIGDTPSGALIGLPFGQVTAAQLRELMELTKPAAIRTTPWRMLLLEGTPARAVPGFITEPDDPLLRVDACPGAPFCTSATVETRGLARRLAGRTTGTLHVSGCAKGCARPRPADVTLVGRDGRFDLVRGQRPWDAPERTGLTPGELDELFETP